MLKRNQLVDKFNSNLRAIQSAGGLEKLTPITNEVISRWIQSNKLPDKQNYPIGETIQLMFKLWIKENSEALGNNKHHKWSPVEARNAETIYALYFLGLRIREIAARAGCSGSTVKRRLRKRLIFAIGRPTYRRIVIQALHEDGWSVKEIAESLNITDRTVRRVLNR